MEPREYDVMRAVEDRHWWYRGLHALVLSRLAGARRVLDAGCGTGAMLARLGGRGAAGVDLSPLALAHCRGRGLPRLTRGSAGALPFLDGSFDALLALDVLYHREVRDEAAALAEFARVLRPGGLLLLHLPAYPALAGSHDRAVHGARRYTAGGVRRLVAGAGLAVEELTYRNVAALAGALILRPWRRGKGPGDGSAPPSDLGTLPRFAEALLAASLRLENALVGRLPIPAGLSVWCVARKGA